MKNKIIGYLLLSLFSFFFFSGFFFVATNAQAEGDYRAIVGDSSFEPEQSLFPVEKYITPMPTPTDAPVIRSAIFEPATPTPTQSAIAMRPRFVPEGLEELFNKYGSEYGVDPEFMKKIARCESGFNANSVGGGGLYMGMFQFVEGTWVHTRQVMGVDPNPDLRLNGEEAIRTAAYMLSKGRAHDWPVCSK